MIRMTGIRKVYADGKEALRGVDLELEEGSIGVLGPNGAGKTTLLSILVLNLEPTAGERLYGALDAADAANHPRVRAQIGFLPQDFAPIRDLTGSEYLVHCAALRGIPRDLARRRADALLEAVDLTHARNRRSGEYSGGMRRRLGIAQALIHRPSLIVIDEPTAGLDPEERIRFRNLIADVAEAAAVMVSTHICEDIEATCDRLYVIAGGRCLFDGTVTDFIARHASELRVLASGEPVPSGALLLGRRVLSGGEVTLIHDSRRRGAPYPELRLEDAYNAFRALHRLDVQGTA